ncbi:mechanosensitive ion channel [Chloroflexota bacterium]
MSWDFILDPLQSLFTMIMNYLPRIIGVLVLLFVAWILAKVLRSVTRKVVRASSIDKRLGKGGDIKDKSQYPVAQGAGTAVFWIVWILFILAILEVLGLQGVLSSITAMFEKIFAAIPNILAAIVVLVIFYLVGRLFTNLVTKSLTKIRFDELPVKLGLTQQPTEGASSPSSLVGYIALVFIMLFAITTAADFLGFTVFNQLVLSFTELLALIILGIIVIGVGIFVANLVANILRNGSMSQNMISLVRVFIIVLSIAIGLRAMGFANDIILLIFGLMLAAIAIAAAIAFGLGGRKVAGQLLERWTKSSSSNSDKTGE